MNNRLSKHSVLLIDMGGPHNLDEVKPYLQKIFSDPRIIPGNPIKRWILSRLIAAKSAEETKKRYAIIGGKSNAVENARKLANQLTDFFAKRKLQVECEVATRYSFPDIPDGLDELLRKQNAPLTAVYLFPHNTIALTGSCVDVLTKSTKKRGIPIDYHVKHLGKTQTYIQGWANGIKKAVKRPKETFVMLTAHSLPISIINQGDQYLVEVEKCADQVKALLGDVAVDLAYQSQEGKNWVGPTVEEKATAAREQGYKELIIAPLSFVGDNTETLLDIDLDLFKAIQHLGFERFERIPPPDQQGFLCDMVAEALSQEWGLESEKK